MSVVRSYLLNLVQILKLTTAHVANSKKNCLLLFLLLYSLFQKVFLKLYFTSVTLVFEMRNITLRKMKSMVKDEVLLEL